MACDFSISADTARFGQAGPKHGSAPDGGSTDFLDLFVGIERSMQSIARCDQWSAHKALRYGLLTSITPVLKNPEGEWIPNPFVRLEETDSFGNEIFGDYKTGEERKEAKETFSECETDFTKLDKEVNDTCYSLALTMPGCLTKSIQSVRKKKLEHWQKNSETNRSWLALNMMTEAKAGFRAFNEGSKGNREVDFLELRRRLAGGEPWTEELVEELIPE